MKKSGKLEWIIAHPQIFCNFCYQLHSTSIHYHLLEKLSGVEAITATYPPYISGAQTLANQRLLCDSMYSVADVANHEWSEYLLYLIVGQPREGTAR